MASLFPTGLQIGQSPGADPLELNIDKPILATHPQRFRDRDEHIMSGLLNGASAAFDLNVNNITVVGGLTVAGASNIAEAPLIFASIVGF